MFLIAVSCRLCFTFYSINDPSFFYAKLLGVLRVIAGKVGDIRGTLTVVIVADIFNQHIEVDCWLVAPFGIEQIGEISHRILFSQRVDVVYHVSEADLVDVLLDGDGLVVGEFYNRLVDVHSLRVRKVEECEGAFERL